MTKCKVQSIYFLIQLRGGDYFFLLHVHFLLGVGSVGLFFPPFRLLVSCFGSACTSSCTRSKGRHSRRRTRVRPACSRTGSRWTTGCSSQPRASSSPSRLLSCKCPAKRNARLSAAVVEWSSASKCTQRNE